MSAISRQAGSGREITGLSFTCGSAARRARHHRALRRQRRGATARTLTARCSSVPWPRWTGSAGSPPRA